MNKVAAVVFIISLIVWVIAALVFASCVWFGNNSKVAADVSIWVFIIGYFAFVIALAEL